MTHPAPPALYDPSARQAWSASLDGEPARLLIRWPIVDDTLTRSKLIAVARGCLAEFCRYWRATLVDVTWQEVAVDDGPELHAIAQVVVADGIEWNDAGRLEYLEPEVHA